ncbi:unnamed protein product [Prorocentrum cordatum]|uniref:EF-hand domain-containing protein n=1 Tax=Prorocentrum cordatum TaxID=2364126 RepID=A0ABN9UZT1_9DINO|nr:unnamed protein product [Polarella glacialis]
MLIGVLCEVVSAVAATEKEEMNVLALRSKLAEVMLKLDTSGNGRLSQEEFVQLVSDAQAVKLLDEMGIDPISLIDMAPTIFEPREDDSDDDSDDGVERLDSSKGREIDFQEFMKVVLDLRGSNAASLKDLRELKKDLIDEVESLKMKLNVSRRRSSSGHAGFNSRRESPAPHMVNGSKSMSMPDLMVTSVPNLNSFVNGYTGKEATDAPHAAPQLRSLGPASPSGGPGPAAPPRGQAPCIAGGTPEQCAGAGAGRGAGGVDVDEVEQALFALQAACARARRDAPLEVAAAAHDRDVCNWVEGVGRSASSELQQLHRMRKVHYVDTHQEMVVSAVAPMSPNVPGVLSGGIWPPPPPRSSGNPA